MDRRTTSMLALALTLLGYAGTVLGQAPNNNAAPVPAQSVLGLASMAGGFAFAGSWLLARRRRK